MAQIPDRIDPMALALDEARAAGARGEVPVGAIILRDGEVLARAGNRTLELKDPTAHAEILAIRAACEVPGSERLIGCDLYVTLELAPCALRRSRSRACAASIGARRTPRAGRWSMGRVFLPSRHAIMRRNAMGTFAKARAAALLRGFFLEKR